jgi:hypothetical protein
MAQLMTALTLPFESFITSANLTIGRLIPDRLKPHDVRDAPKKGGSCIKKSKRIMNEYN